MTLGVDELRRLSTLLDKAMDLDEAGREAWLANLAEGDAPLRPTLVKILAQQGLKRTDDLIERGPSFTAVVGADDEPANQFAAGEHIGPYRLERPIGQGGMGEVWLAVRDDGQLKRQVALKLPMLNARRAVLVQRFARERDILGSLAHPHIARLYDAGVGADGQPYLALEYVQGQAITAYCDEHQLDQRARIELLLQVLQAVQYAHANLVIHRDLKPSNVLVTAQGQAMLLDFGIAKLLQEDAADAAETELTRLGGRALTLAYAAPEQVSGAPISIATDVWALGVLLYEILTRLRPFAGKQRDLEQAILAVEPARPRSVPPDLATIVLKALKKAPAERYATVNALAEDLQRWLRNEPVLAQPDRLGYRVRKFVRRHRAPVAVGALVTVVLVTTSGIALLQATEARRQAATAREKEALATEKEALAKQEARRAQEVQTFLVDLFRANTNQQADPVAARQASARDLLDRGAARIEKALSDSPQSRLEVMGTLADMYMQLSLEEQAAALQERRMALARNFYGPSNVQLADVLLSYVETLHEGPRRARIPPLLAEAMGVLDRAGDDRSDLRGYALLQAALYARYESLAEALRAADAAVDFNMRFHPDRGAVITAYQLASGARLAAGDFEGARKQAALACEAAKRRATGSEAWLRGAIIHLGEAQQEAMLLADAEASFRAAAAMSTHLSGAESPNTLTTITRLANVLVTTGRAVEGDALLARVRLAMQSGDSSMTLQWRVDEGAMLVATSRERGRPDLVLAPEQADIDDMRKLTPNTSLLAQHERRLAEAQADLGDIAAANRTMDAADASWQRASHDLDAPVVATAFAISRAHVALAAGDGAAAMALLGTDRPAAPRDVIERRIERAHAYLALGQPANAVAEADAALQSIQALPQGQRPVSLRAMALQRRSQALRARGDEVGAVSDLKSALALRRANDDKGSRWVASIERELEDKTRRSPGRQLRWRRSSLESLPL